LAEQCNIYRVAWQCGNRGAAHGRTDRGREGGILLSVHSDNSDWTRKAKEILQRTGADDISSASEEKADFPKTDKPMPRAS
jgi:hypothetical protein